MKAHKYGFGMILALGMALAGVAESKAQGRAFSEMTSAEIVALLDAGTGISFDSRSGKKASAPVEVSAADMATKVFGLLPSETGKKDVLRKVDGIAETVDSDSTSIVWADGGKAYSIEYNGIAPDMSAMARYNGEELSDYAFFFLFPYAENEKVHINYDQAQFSGSLLQEMYDRGFDMGQNMMSQDLFEAMGDYDGNYVNVRLIDDGNAGSGGRYILFVSVEPNAFTEADSIAAL